MSTVPFLSDAQMSTIRSWNITNRRAAHALSGAVLTWLYLMVLWIALPTSISLIIVWVGVPMLLTTLALVRGLAAMERRLATVLLDVRIDAPPKVSELQSDRRGRLRALVTHNGTWRGCAYLAVRWVGGLTSFVLAVTSAALVVGFALLPFNDQILQIDGWRPPTGLRGAWGPVAAVIVAVVGWRLLAVIGWLEGLAAKALLGPSSQDRMAVLESRTATLTAQTQLARDLHDSVGHTMTSVVVQAGAARRVFDNDPGFAKEALGEIETSARRALDELDYMIGVLRNDQGQPAGRSPIPTLADVAQVLQTAERNGLRVTSALTGSPEALPGSVSRECFRIVQEGITNVTKHAPGSHATVRIDIGATSVSIEISNPTPSQSAPTAFGTAMGTARSEPGGGRGLLGIQERAQALGGVAWAGFVEGSHVLRVVIPFDPTAPTSPEPMSGLFSAFSTSGRFSAFTTPLHRAD